jgi:SAM-dependent methyltransferase
MSDSVVQTGDLLTFRQRAHRLWRESGLLNIKPLSVRYGEYPEGWDAVEELRRILMPFVRSSVLEVGCGYGRLCRAFPPDQYIGVDINPDAIARAKSMWPGYKFQVVDYLDEYPKAGLVLFYTVMLHLADQDVRGFIEKFASQPETECLVVAEIMVDKILDSNFDANYETSDRLHSVINRPPKIYIDIAHAAGFLLHERIVKRYHYYKDTDIEILVFRRAPPKPSEVVIPDSLSNPLLEYEGVFDDGWTETSFDVELEAVADAKRIIVEAMYPMVAGQPEQVQFQLRLGNEPVKEFTFNCGAIRVEEMIHSHGVMKVGLRFSRHLTLPAPDGRSVGFHLSRVGFE